MIQQSIQVNPYKSVKNNSKRARKMNSPCTVITEGQNLYRYCRHVTHLNFNLDQYFGSLIEKYVRNPNIKPLIVEPNIKRIQEENDMNIYLRIILVYPSFFRVSENISREPHNKKHKIEYDNIASVNPDFVVRCEEDNLFIIEMKFESKFLNGKRLISY